MRQGSGRRAIRSVIPLLLLGVAVWGVADELQYRSAADRTTATVTAWRPDRLGGLRGTATADVDRPGGGGAYADRPVRTHLWYRPGPGDRVPVYHQLGSAPGRVDSAWQGFLLPAVAGVIAAGWLAEVWWPRRHRPGAAEPG